jgi:hypothetical protein
MDIIQDVHNSVEEAQPTSESRGVAISLLAKSLARDDCFPRDTSPSRYEQHGTERMLQILKSVYQP